MAELFDTKYFSGQGPVFIGLRDATGAPMGLEFLGDLASATLTPNVDIEKIIENVTGLSSTGASFVKKVDYSVTLQMRSIKHNHLTLALQASNTAKTAGTVTDEPQKGYKGKFIVLKHTKISTVVVTGAGGTPTYVNNTDYIVHPDRGMIEIVAAGAITDGLVLLIDYAYAAQHHIAAAPSNKNYYLVFTGVNRADNNKQTRCEIYSILLSPSALSMIEDKSTEMPLTGTINTDLLRATGDQLFSWKTED
jgi:hypothetical protein